MYDGIIIVPYNEFHLIVKKKSDFIEDRYQRALTKAGISAKASVPKGPSVGLKTETQVKVQK